MKKLKSFKAWILILAFLTVSFIAFLSYQLLNTNRSLKTLQEHFFPTFEQSAINVKLNDEIHYELLLASHSEKSAEKAQILQLALRQNLNSYLESIDPFKLASEVDRAPLENLETLVMAKLAKKDYRASRGLLEDRQYQQTRDEFTESLRALVEELSLLRESIIERERRQLSLDLFTVLAASLFFVLSWSLLIYAYRRSEQQRKTIASELELQKAKTQEAAKFTALGETAGQIAHEINSPLGAILLTAESIKMQSDDESKPVDLQLLRSDTDRIITISRKISKLTRSLLSFTRNHVEEPEVRSLASLLDESLLLCGESLKRKGVQLNVAEDFPTHIKVKCTPSLIQQVFINLLNNAGDAVKSSDKKRVEITGVTTNQSLRIHVIDKGPGVPEGLEEKIFEPAFSTKGKNGNGFGLSLSRDIAESHGGRLYYDVEASESTFVLELPRVA